MRSPTVLGLAVLRLLAVAPQHPYELRRQMRDQGLDTILKVTHGALYYTVESLAKAALIEPAETSRQGNRPERTVYAITPAGREVARERLRELLATPEPDRSTYCAALALLSLLPPAEAAERLALRSVLLEGELAAAQARHAALIDAGTPPVALVEMRHMQAHLRADVELTRALREDIASGALNWETEER
ncbi:PadR family transcriptional regulator [Pseudonocardia sp. CA-107938]|uniref:PadR family transcriptional regulator n=1 Tax=Pseudonocardia sp. CA-107938 TaxID=3240021 RepID=UPI003D912293